MNNVPLAKWFLRIGLAFVFAYAAIEIYIDPVNFLKFVPPFVTDLVPLDLFLFVFGMSEIFIVLWFLSGWKLKYPALLAFFIMVGIVIFNLQYFPILFRNVAIGFAALALFVLD